MASEWTCALCEATSKGTAVRRVNQSDICTWCRDELKRTGRGYCPRCKASYSRDEMSDGYCKAHKREMNKAYREANREREAARVAAWKAAHPQPRPHHWRSYVRNPDQDRARSRAWHQANRARDKARQRTYTQAKATENPNYWRERYQQAKARAWRAMRGEL